MIRICHYFQEPKRMLVDTHCHIHDDEFYVDDDRDLVADAATAGVEKLICIGTDAKSSVQAVEFCRGKKAAYAAVGLHPHDARLSGDNLSKISELAADKSNNVVAIGECGLDYFYENSNVDDQKQALIEQFEIAQVNNLPMVFHIRGSAANPDDAFSDFWPIYDRFSPSGVIHSFSANSVALAAALKRDLYIGINGIITFTKDNDQLQTMLSVPLDRLVLETDSPFLTPVPFRGKVNVPKNTNLIAEFIAQKRGVEIKELAQKTTTNANKLFNI